MSKNSSLIKIKNSKNLFDFSFFFFLIILFLIPMSDAQAATTIKRPPNNLNLVGYWSFDGDTVNTSTTTDISGNGNDGTIVGNAYPALGKIGQAMSFDGTGDYVSVADNPTISVPNFTISFWEKVIATDTSGTAFIVKRNNTDNQEDFNIYSSTAGSIIARVGGLTDPAVYANAEIIDGNWHFVTVTTDGSLIRIYYEGNFVSSDGVPDAFIDGTYPLTMGFMRGNPAFDLNGSLDDVRIYNRALMPQEVKDLYNSTKGGKVNVTRPPTGDSLSNGLVGHWSFDGGTVTTSTTTDISGNGNDGTIVGAIPTLGKIGQAMSFDGTGDYINAGGNSGVLNLTGNFSASAWFKTSSTGVIEIINKTSGAATNGYEIYINNGVIYTRTNSENTSFSPLTYKDGIWHHVVMTFDGSLNKIFVDGGQVDSEIANIPASNTSAAFNIGARAGLLNFNGSIDDVRIYNRALSAQEIADLYNATKGGKVNVTRPPTGDGLSNGLVGHWSFDGDTVTTSTTTDISGNGNDGTIVGNTKPALGKIGQAMSFDGSGDYITIPYTDLGVNWTYSFWAKVNSTADYGVFSVGGLRTYITLSGGNKFYVRSQESDTTIVSGLSYGVTRYYHFVLTGDGTYVTAYQDGLYKDKVNFSSSGTTMRVSQIGTGYSGLSYFNGSIDDVRIYNRALTPAEIQRLYSQGH